MPLRVSSSPTTGPTISLPTIVKFGRPACFSALVICSRALLNAPPDSSPTSGTRTMTWRDSAVAILLHDRLDARERLLHGAAHLLDADLLLELRDDDRAAGELDAERDPLGEHDRDARQHDRP